MSKENALVEKFTAEQAFRLAKSKERPVDQILKDIENAAGYGNRFLMIVDLSNEATIELIGLGYSVSRHTDPFGMEQTKIRW